MVSTPTGGEAARNGAPTSTHRPMKGPSTMPASTKLASAHLLGAAALVAAHMTLIPAIALAGNDDPHRETMQERQACTPDVLRLCRALVPNRKAITDCLVANVERLSPACHEVMAHRP